MAHVRLSPTDRVLLLLDNHVSQLSVDVLQSAKDNAMSIYDVPAMMGLAYPRAMTPANIQSGFKVSRIRPFHRNIFTDDEFLPTDVNDRPPPPEQQAAGVRDAPTLGDAAGVRDAPK